MGQSSETQTGAYVWYCETCDFHSTTYVAFGAADKAAKDHSRLKTAQGKNHIVGGPIFQSASLNM